MFCESPQSRPNNLDTIQAGPQAFDIKAVKQNIIRRCNIHYNTIGIRRENAGLDVTSSATPLSSTLFMAILFRPPPRVGQR